MYTLYPHQNEAVDSVWFYYANGGNGDPVIAMPTATGKSLVIAKLIHTIMHRWPRQRILMATHVKELIEQNAEKIREQWPAVPLGIYSAGLGRKDTNYPIVYGGVASIINNIKAFGWRDLMIVDEAHLISPKDGSEYRTVINELRKINPLMRVIGLTATPYRMGMGLITDKETGIFSDICYNLCTMDGINRLIREGYLVTPIPKRTNTELDVSKVSLSQGEFQNNELQAAVDVDSLTLSACKEIIEEGFDRIAWLAFASGIKHSEHIAATLQHFGIDALTVHSKMPAKEATRRIKLFKAGRLRCIVNYGKLTTGFDHPPIDLIADLRPTMSTGLHVQKIGRGMRPSLATHKENCLVLDFARNTARLGPINDPVIPRKRVKGDTPGVAPIRLCDACGVYNHARAFVCIACGKPFDTTPKLTHSAGTHELIRTAAPVTQVFKVTRVIYRAHAKAGQPPIMRVMYHTPLRMFSEYVCFEHKDYALKKAKEWWMARAGTFTAPPTTADALVYVSQLREPKTITVIVNKKYPEVVACEY